MLSIENCEKNIKFSHVYIQSLVPVPSLDITDDIQSGSDPGVQVALQNRISKFEVQIYFIFIM